MRAVKITAPYKQHCPIGDGAAIQSYFCSWQFDSSCSYVDFPFKLLSKYNENKTFRYTRFSTTLEERIPSCAPVNGRMSFPIKDTICEPWCIPFKRPKLLFLTTLNFHGIFRVLSLCLCNKSNYSSILIGSHLWSIKGQTLRWHHYNKHIPSGFFLMERVTSKGLLFFFTRGK